MILRWGRRGKAGGCQILWGYSSAGRAPALQAGGHEFDPRYLHRYQKMPQQLHMGLKLSWLERTPDKREVGGSSPLKPIGHSQEGPRNLYIDNCT